ncbi:hypothetical protein M3Y98_01160100 [Aphelenchoides besseyi]|nr:hypothetical protein M3Y98_01160100 [Aphelenchoides besseyi]
MSKLLRSAVERQSSSSSQHQIISEMSPVRLTNSTLVLNAKIRKMKYICFAFFLFDLIYGCSLLSIPIVRSTVFGYVTLFLFYSAAVIAAMFGVKDHVIALLYPIIIIVANTALHNYTAMLINQIAIKKAASNGELPTVDVTCSYNSKPILEWHIGLIFLSVFIILQKSAEFVVVRRLMHLLRSAATTTTNTEVTMRETQESANDTRQSAPSNYEQPEKMMREIKDSDDDGQTELKQVAAKEAETKLQPSDYFVVPNQKPTSNTRPQGSVEQKSNKPQDKNPSAAKSPDWKGLATSNALA